MRQLNKIVFINSATIRYQEVLLDGNVHFIGTQGVGKSTVLRAILFFYNGDTQKLGIAREKKIFADYYFPNTNSYILYEVQRETGPFTVLLMRSGSGVVFRFIDSGYDQNWILKDKQPMERWGNISEALNKLGIDSSKRIDRLADYRDIIYGNPAVAPAHRKYSLLESKQFQNIPRTITNVFLNTKLEASFIKETIIHSLSEEELRIDLLAYRNHLHDFEKQYEDIQTFLQPKTQEQAEKIIGHFNHIRQGKARQLYTAARLQTALKLAEKELEQQKAQLKAAFNQQKEKQQNHEEREKRKQNEVSLINGSIKSIEAKIREAQKKERQYQQKGIESILPRFAREQEWKNTATQLNSERATLTTKFESLEQQFQVLKQQLDNQVEHLKTNQRQQQQEVQQKLLEQKEGLNLERDKQLQELEKLQEEKMEALQEQEKRLAHKLAEWREQRVALKEKQWRGAEIAALKAEIAAAKNAAEAKALQSMAEKENRSHLRKEWAREEEKLKEEKERQHQQLQATRQGFKQQLSAVESKLARYQNAFYGFLQENYPAWRETIGRVAREELLFNENLAPKLKELNALFFGLELDLENVETSAKSLKEYEAEKQRLQEQVAQQKKNLSHLETKLAGNLNRLTKRFKPKLREISDRLQRLEIEQQQKQEQAQKGGLQLEELAQKAQEEREQALEKIEQQLTEARANWQAQQKLIQQQKQHGKEQQKKIRLAADKKVMALERQRAKKLPEIANRFQAALQETQKKLEQLKQQQQQKLKAAGADTQRLAQLDEKLEQVKGELQFITENRELVIEYHKDKRELFDPVNQFKTEREKEILKLERAQQRLNELKREHQETLRHISNTIEKGKEKISKLEDGFAEFAAFSKSEIYAQLENHPANLENHGDAYAVRTTIQELRDTSHELNTWRENLRDSSHRFLSRFSEANLFHFPTQLNATEDYLRFAADVKEFIDEQKITEYEKRVNARFATILNSVSKETGDLISREGDIQKVVTNINRDFRARNFVGVIQSMELKVEDSANRVVNTLKRIRQYEQERGFALGHNNLFNYQAGEDHNKRAVDFLQQLNRDILAAKRDEIILSDAFEIRFRVVENENDSGWVEKLSNVGSEGTDVLVKAMINILLLNVFKESASRKFKDFRLHCMMDEVGRLHPTNVRGILKFANDRNIMLINGSPVEQDAMAYRHIYELRKDPQSHTRIRRLITVRQERKTTVKNPENQ